MSSFEETKWSATDYAADYLKKVDAIIPQRQRMLEVFSSFYSHFLGDGTARKIIELGSGDGAFTEEFLKLGLPIQATLIDGSEEMLARAKVRLAGYKSVNFIHSSFQDLGEASDLPKDADLIFSVLAIHHLTPEYKRRLFELIYSRLAPGGFFLNFDDCVPISSLIEDWHVQRWKDEVSRKAVALGIEINPQSYIDKHHDPDHHKTLETVDSLCSALKATGFVGAECFFRDGIFTLYGGQKPEPSNQ